MYNGIGLNTPRGSGTSGHITRNLSTIRPRDDYRSMGDRDMPVQHRAPDAAILEHERKRRIEVQCLELQDSLEEKGATPEDIEAQVDQLRQTLVAQARSQPPGQGAERGAIKNFQRHELLAAKAVDNARFERAFNISRDYVEGDSLNKEKQEERRAQRQLEKEQRQEELTERKRAYEAEQERRQAERAADAEKHRIEVESRAKERESRMRDIQRERETDSGRSAPRGRNDGVDSHRPGPSRGDSTRRSRSPPARRPVSGRPRSYSRSRSRSPSPRGDSHRARKRSYSPPRGSRAQQSRPSRSLSRSRSPPRRGRSRTRSYSRSSGSRSRSPPRKNGTSRRRSVDSRSPSPAGKRSPPRRKATSPVARSTSKSPRRREPSASGSEDMDVQSD